MEEQEAIARLKRGDLSGLEVMVRKYQVRAIRAAYLIVGERALAEDIVQEAFLRLSKRIAQFDVNRPFGAWLMRSIMNDAIKRVSRDKHYLSFDADLTDGDLTLGDLLADREPGPAELSESAETQEMVQAALSKLPPQQRAAIVLRYYLDLSEAEMSQELNCPPGTIKWRLHAARKQLQVLLRSLRHATE